MKELYKFTIPEKVEGEDEPTMHQILIKKPNRREIEEADMEYSVAMSSAVSKGVLTKQMLAKKYSDTGGLMSETDATDLFDLYKQLFDLSNKYAETKSLDKGTKKEQEKLEAISDELIRLRRQVVDKESQYQSLFDHTAEVKAQNKVIRWYALNLTYKFNPVKDEFEPFFGGKTYDEKVDNYYEMEDGDNETYFKIMSKVATILSLWFFNSADDQEGLDKLLEQISEKDEDEKKPKAKQAPAKKKTAAKKRAPRKKAAPKPIEEDKSESE